MNPWTKFFTRSEFACKCGCGQDTVDAELLHVIVNMRAVRKHPIIPTSANRCVEHNRKVGGAKDSQHIISKALDFYEKGVDPGETARFLQEAFPDKYGIGVYNSWVHIDVRPEKARWDKRDVR